MMIMRDLNLASVDLNLLPALEALLRRRHVTRAAADVGLSQPAMSHVRAPSPCFGRRSPGARPFGARFDSPRGGDRTPRDRDSKRGESDLPSTTIRAGKSLSGLAHRRLRRAFDPVRSRFDESHS